MSDTINPTVIDLKLKIDELGHALHSILNCNNSLNGETTLCPDCYRVAVEALKGCGWPVPKD